MLAGDRRPGAGTLKLWKVLGVAGLAGVAATGIAVARGERRRRSYGPDDVRARLHQRHAEAVEAGADLPVEPESDGGKRVGRLRRAWTRLARRQ